MYNAEIKNQFLQDFSKSVTRQAAAANMFNALEPYEESWGADVCTRSIEEVQSVMQSLIGVRTNSSAHRTSIIRGYATWCCDHGVPGANRELCQIEGVVAPQVEKIRRQWVASPAHLQRCLDSLCDPVSEETIHCVLRCYLWLAFSGLPEEDALSIPISAVDFSDLVIRYNGKDYPIYREAVPAFRACARLLQFRTYKSRSTKDRWTYVDRGPGDWLLRCFRTSQDKHYFRVLLSQLNRANDTESGGSVKLAYSRVHMSGVFYRTYEAERSLGVEPDFHGYVYQTFANQDTPLPNNRANYMNRLCLRDYENWKAAFSV